ncbi:MAG: hypothetical protein AAGA99_21240 [Actinomycetota bacterium]
MDIFDTELYEHHVSPPDDEQIKHNDRAVGVNYGFAAPFINVELDDDGVLHLHAEQHDGPVRVHLKHGTWFQHEQPTHHDPDDRPDLRAI